MTRKVSREVGKENLSSLNKIFESKPTLVEAKRHKIVMRSVKSTFQQFSNSDLYEMARVYEMNADEFPLNGKGRKQLVDALVGEYLIRMSPREKSDMYAKVITADQEIERFTGKKLQEKTSNGPANRTS